MRGLLRCGDDGVIKLEVDWSEMESREKFWWCLSVKEASYFAWKHGWVRLRRPVRKPA